MTAARLAELEANLAEVRGRIGAAEAAAGRAAGSVRLVVVTKTWPASDVRLLAGLGIADVAENRDQEARPKAAQCADLDAALALRRPAAAQQGRATSCPTPTSCSPSTARARPRSRPGRDGVGPDGRHPAPGRPRRPARAAPGRGGAGRPGCSRRPRGRLRGAPAARAHGGRAARGGPRAAFARLAVVAADLRRDHPEAVVLSAGMSEDLEEAVEAGATHVRVGTAVLGGRPALR